VYFGPTSGDKDFYVSFGTLGDSQFRNVTTIDPRALGVVLAYPSAMYHERVDSLLGMNTDNKVLTKDAAKWNAQDCYIVHIAGTKAKTSIWIVPSADYNVVRIETKGFKYPTGSAIILETEIEQYGPKGIWFPKSLVLSTLRDGVLVW